MKNLTPVQRTKNDLVSTGIILVGFILGLFALIFFNNNFGAITYGLILIFIGSIYSNILKFFALLNQLELFKDIDLLILDEATSALDSETEQVIQQQIEQLKGQYTMLTIAHRLSTIKNADKVILIQDGTIHATGTYNELATTNDKFKNMINTQSL